MEKQPLIRIDGVFESDHVNATDLSGTVTNEFGSLFSLFPGSDWYDFGGVAIQADPCETCGGRFIVYLNCCQEPPCGHNIPCPKCHGLGVIPRHGSIQPRRDFGYIHEAGNEIRHEWSDTCQAARWLVLVVPIKGGNPPATI